jgi:hypothetical protein
MAGGPLFQAFEVAAFEPAPPVAALSLQPLLHPLSDNPKTAVWNRNRPINRVFRAWAKDCSAAGRVFFEGEGKGMNFPRRGNRG